MRSHVVDDSRRLGSAVRVRLSTYPGGRGGRERAAKRSSDRPRGAEPPAPDYVLRAEPPAPDYVLRAEPPAPDYVLRAEPPAPDYVLRAEPPAPDYVLRAE